MTIAEFNNVSKKYGSMYAVYQISMQIESGKVIGLLGPNGSGKTTLIKMLTGLLQPTSGEILVHGKPVGVESKKVISYLPDQTYLSESMSVKEALDYFSDFYADFRMDVAKKMLDNLGIQSNSKFRTLSKGTKEKVQLILVMSRQADLYVLDEPIAGVDPAARDYIIQTIMNNFNKEASVLISTHLISDIEAILDEVIFIQAGQLCMISSVDSIKEKEGKTIDAYFREVFRC